MSLSSKLNYKYMVREKLILLEIENNNNKWMDWVCGRGGGERA